MHNNYELFCHALQFNIMCNNEKKKFCLDTGCCQEGWQYHPIVLFSVSKYARQLMFIVPDIFIVIKHHRPLFLLQTYRQSYRKHILLVSHNFCKLGRYMVLLINITFLTKRFLNWTLFGPQRWTHTTATIHARCRFLYFYQHFVLNHSCSFSKTGRTHGRPAVAGK